MGPIGCIGMLIAQVFHLIFMIIALPLVLIGALFANKNR